MLRRSRSPRRRSPRRRSPKEVKKDRTERSFSISSLSDCSVGNIPGNGSRNGEKSKDRHKRHSRTCEKHYDDREKRIKKERHTDSYPSLEHNSFQSVFDEEQQMDPSICDFGDSQMSHSEPSYIQQKNPSPGDDRLVRLEKMVEMLAQTQGNLNKHQSSSFNHSQEIRSTSLEVVPKATQFITSVWLNKVNEECLERQFDEITCINFMQSKMSGLMKAWFKTLAIYEYTWPELKMLVTNTFPDTVDFASTLHLLVNRMKRPDETVTQYYFSKMYLIEACKISGPNAVSCLIDGLNDLQLQREAKELNFLTPEMFYAQFLTKLPNFGLGNQIVEQKPVLEILHNHEVREREEYHPHNFKKRGKEHNEFQKKCYTCGKHGHISENCRHAPVCYNCGHKGHIAAKCSY